MSSSNRRFDTTWQEINEELSEEVRSKIPSKDRETGENLQNYDKLGAEEEHIVERTEPNGNTEAVERSFSNKHLKNIAEKEEAKNVETIPTNNNGSIAGVYLETDNYEGFSEYDVGPEKEDVTTIQSNIGDLLENLNEIEQTTVNTSPERNVAFKRQGTLTEMMLRDSDGEFNWNKAENHNYPDQKFITGKPRYFAFDDTYTGVMQVAGTGSIQVTMRPKIYDKQHDGVVDEDKWVRDFSGGGERVGLHALSPLFYGPFQASPVIDEDRENIETLNGRDKAYGQGFQTEWDSKGLGKTEEEYVTENSKACYSPALSEIQTIEDLQNFKAESEWTFSAPTPLENMLVVDEEETYDPEENYETLVEHVSNTSFDFLDPQDKAVVRVGHENWMLEDDRNTINLTEFPEHERFEGKIYLVDEEENKEGKRVVVDYQNEEIFSNMSEKDFAEEYRNHFEADATSVWEPFRMRPSSPAFEYRDMCNNPFRDAGIATQVGVFRKWREIQEFAEEELGLYEENAQDLRIGIDKEGLQYEINEEKGITLQDAWMGSSKLNTSLYDIVETGIEELEGENYSVEKYRETMLGTNKQPGLISNGLTPAEMMASEHGVDIEGEILYNSQDIFVNENPYQEQEPYAMD